MSKEQKDVPDAWEADWESLADNQDQKPETPPKKVSSKVTKAQRRAAQAEFNRKLWEEAETPQTFHYIESRSAVPLKQDFKPAVTVLSRRPQIAVRNNNIDAAGEGISNLNINGSGANLSDSDEETNKPPEMTPEERQAKALRDREEKQRKYEEARERLFGNSSTPGSNTSSPGGTRPSSRNRDSGFDSSGTRGGSGGRGRNRGHGNRDRDSNNNNNSNNREKRDSPGGTGKQRQLYDPGYSTKPNSSTSYSQRRPPQLPTERSDGEQQQQAIRPSRNPRGPDGSGRGGFGFSPRGRGTLVSRDAFA
ncbi:conserved hypothetical protein [Talaromyces stipitatus ATCC 10500]|uniref:Uncharacterized protein n=1 Tax=Talaromyces stipitatus (strain ATCC 10500 / CBS 375.48 / QM 6759 / NRRL 1006) TaxID=441959 RepID=B8LWC3_TALSN|nr:uncharacterized protein TSTA_076050 [Talaromyces stipitatus ATCC 10500]EED24234.1 conserved hypothetical protein [Talaromyces stipitatus ATCC 10500]